ncbi:MAG: HAD family phosphatase [Ruminococcaceae bacterium]|nr:HAD family phosphatase [Oscillospiraceae bacterium]
MSTYKIISTDLDGTLFNEHGVISPENEAAIKELHERGVLVVPNSGRCLSEMPAIITDHALFRYLIQSDGAVVYDKQTEKRLTRCLPKAVSDAVFEILKDHPASVSVRQDGFCYVRDTAHNDADYIKNGVSRGWRDHFYKTATPTDFSMFDAPDTAIEMFCVFFADMQEREACIQRLLALGTVQVASTDANNIEVFSVHAGKGKALLALAESLGIDKKDTIGVGDSTNDSDMILRAGTGLVMENACPELKALGDTVICHHRDHAMRYILEHYIK